MGAEVDARGLPCPRPVVETKKALDAIQKGTVTVLVDSAESRENVRRFAVGLGCQVEVTERDGAYCLEITGGQAAEPERKMSGDVVLICSDRLGIGDERLGEILMRAFLNTLWDSEPRPGKLVFMNDGVRLTSGGSEGLDTLMLLERDGVQIVSCGTCLDYYGLKEQLGVGLVTNMYDTVNSLLAADKVIKV